MFYVLINKIKSWFLSIYVSYADLETLKNTLLYMRYFVCLMH